MASVNASYTVLIPLIPELRDRAHATPAVLALAFGLFAAAKALAQPVAGRWVDRRQPRQVACISLLVAAAGVAMTALARDPLMLLGGRVCWGVGEGSVTPALYVGLVALCRRYGLSETRMMGRLGSAAVTGFLIGPLIAGLAATSGIRTLLLSGAVVIAGAALAILGVMPRANLTATTAAPGDPSSAQQPGPPGGAPDLPAARWWVPVLVLGGLDMATNLSYSALEPTLPLYLVPAPGESPRTAISVVFVVGLAVFGLSAWVIGRRADQVRLIRLIQLGLALSAVGVSGLAISPRPPDVVAWFILIMVAQAVLYFAARRGIVELRSAVTRPGRAFGLFGLASDVGNSLGPLLGVALFVDTGRVSFVVLGGLSALVLLAQLAVTSRRGRPPGRAEAGLTAASQRWGALTRDAKEGDT